MEWRNSMCGAHRINRIQPGQASQRRPTQCLEIEFPCQLRRPPTPSGGPYRNLCQQIPTRKRGASRQSRFDVGPASNRLWLNSSGLRVLSHNSGPTCRMWGHHYHNAGSHLTSFQVISPRESCKWPYMRAQLYALHGNISWASLAYIYI